MTQKVIMQRTPPKLFLLLLFFFALPEGMFETVAYVEDLPP